MNFLVAFLAIIFDRFLVLPQGIIDKLGHPVIWQGKLIGLLEKPLNHVNWSNRRRRIGGVIMLGILIFVTLIISTLIVQFVRPLAFSWAIEAFIASIFLAHSSLHRAVRAVADALNISLEGGRSAVSKIVGRDTKNLDEHEVSRAAIESLAENSSDGIIAPLFWLVILGLPGIALYKAINTADSMVGHRNERYEDFGKASAKLDDLVNWIPARLTALFYAQAAWFTPERRGKKSWKSAMLHAPNHVSPNAGWPEAALAGALDFGLGGPRTYQGKILNLAPMGQGKRDLVAADIYQALKLSVNMGNVPLVIVGLLALIKGVF